VIQGQEAIDFILANIVAYQATKLALYQLLIDKGIETGAIS
jgi:hypothetical protein